MMHHMEFMESLEGISNAFLNSDLRECRILNSEFGPAPGFMNSYHDNTLQSSARASTMVHIEITYSTCESKTNQG